MQDDPPCSPRVGWLYTGLILALALIFMGQTLIPPEGQALGGLDIRGLFYPWLTTAREAIRAGRLPLWDPYQFAGYPFLANPQVGFFYPPSWLALLLPVNVAISWHVTLHICLAGVGMLLLVRYLTKSWLGALLAALTYAFSGFVAARIFAGHVGLLSTDAWLPWLLLGCAWSLDRGKAWAGMIAGLPLGMAILAGHTSSLIYLGIAWIGFVIYRGFASKQWRLVARQMALAGLMGLALSAVQLLPLIEFSTASTRATDPSFEFATGYSMPPTHLITLIIPEYFGEPIHAGYWSVPNFEELTYYIGTLPLLGMLLALRKPTSRTWYYVGLIVLGLLLALGSYGFFYRLFYDWLPPFRMLRAPGRAAFLYVFAGAALLGEALSAWERASKEDMVALARLMRWTVLIITVVGLAGLAATGAVFAAQHPTDTSGRLWHQIGGWALALIFLLVGAALLWQRLSTRPEQIPKKRAISAALLALLLADLWTFGSKLLRLEPFAPARFWRDAKKITDQVGVFPAEQRVLPWGLSIFEQNGAGQVGLYSLFGYNALEIAVNQAFAASVPDPRSTAYDILGAGYVIAGLPLDDYTQGERALALLAHTGSAWVYERVRVLPIVRMVYATEIIGDSTDAIQRVHAPDFDPATTAILGKPPPCTLERLPLTPGSAQIIERHSGYWLIEAESDVPGLLVLSETAYPGWKVAIDGERTEPLVAYTAIRAVCVPSGTHRVEWTYDPLSYKLGAAITLVTLMATGFATVAWIKTRKAAATQKDITKETTT